MLKFEEDERPSFIELAKLVLTSEDNTLQSKPNHEIAPIREEESKNPFARVNIPVRGDIGEGASSPNASQQMKEDSNSFPRDMESSSNFMTQSELFKNYVEVNNLFVNFGNEMFWFESGGQRIGRIELKSGPDQEETASWKLLGKYKLEFPCHYTTVLTDERHGMFMLGGTGNN